MNKNKPILYIVSPCYNEEDGLDKCSGILLDYLNELINNDTISNQSKILFVNDGSKDRTEEILNNLCKKDNKFAMVSFLANAGHQNAVYAGMMAAKDYADIAITIDADLQQDIHAMPKFIEAYENGADVVYGVRNDRSSDGAFKKFTASMYYKLMKAMGSNLLANSADYRLMSKKALNCLEQYKETNLFLRGLIPTMGLKSDIVYFDVKDRELGQSKYTFSKMFNLALSGITSFSLTPIHLICSLAFILMLISVILLIVLLICSNLTAISGLYVLLTFFVGLILLCIGIVGEYVGTSSIQVKQRPRYIIDYVKINNNEKTNGKKKN